MCTPVARLERGFGPVRLRVFVRMCVSTSMSMSNVHVYACARMAGMNVAAFEESVAKGGERPPPDSRWPETLKQLLSECWQADPAARCVLKQLPPRASLCASMCALDAVLVALVARDIAQTIV